MHQGLHFSAANLAHWFYQIKKGITKENGVSTPNVLRNALLGEIIIANSQSKINRLETDSYENLYCPALL